MSRKLGPLNAIAGVLVLGGAVGLFRGRAATPTEAAECDPSTLECPTDGGAVTVASQSPAAPALPAADACRNVGYLCADLARSDRIRLQRWKDFSGTIVVHVPRPAFESAGDAARLQQAAALGLRAWNGQPFEILTDLQGDRTPHFAVSWTRSLSGSQLGVARTQWSAATGLVVVSLELATRWPFDPSRVVDPEQVRLTAAHEMGHALGLPHSDSERDVMYPTNTATSLSAQDYRAMESLYRLPDGTEISP
jgi:predicted Zn-dependent protease